MKVFMETTQIQVWDQEQLKPQKRHLKSRPWKLIPKDFI